LGKAEAERPLGIAILAVLNIIGGIFGLFGGIALAALSGTVSGLPGLGAISSGWLVAVGIFAIIIGILPVAVGWGFWKGSEWAWTLGVVLYIIGIIYGVVWLVQGNVSSLVSVIIGGLIVYYLFRPNVKAWFGKA
jgi:hypothetical protein